ncbi:Mitochondrial acidic protein mam33 [Rhodosporidiobolus nylandii]
MFARTALRTALRAAPRAARPSALRAAAPSVSRSFVSSALRFEPSALSTKLGEELKFETEGGDAGAEPEFVKAFKAEGVWKVDDVDGSDEIVLRRTFGSEDIRLIFSVSDLDAQPDASEAYPDAADSPDHGSGGVGEEAPAAAGAESSFPVETSITITKPSGGAVTIDAVAQDGLFVINNIAFYPDADVALGMTSEDDWKRQGLYMGPAFENLDESVQSEFEQYLEERGVNSALALFIPDLAEWKEQKEYVRWLEGTKAFIEKEK